MAGPRRSEADARSGEPSRHAGIDPPAGDSLFDTELGDPLDPPLPWRPFGESLRERIGAAGAAVAGIAAICLLAATLARTPHFDAEWRATPRGEIELVRADDAALMPHERQLLVGVSVDGVPSLIVDARMLRRSARWTLDDLDRTLQRVSTAQFDDALRHRAVALDFDDGSSAVVSPTPRGWRSLPLLFWLLCAFALCLHLAASVALLAGRALRNRIYAVMAWCQAANLAMIAVEATLELGVPEPFARLDMPLRMALDLATAAAMVVWACIYPRRLPGAVPIGGAAVLGAVLLVLLHALGLLPQAWWWTQVGVAVGGLCVIGLLSVSYQLEANPLALVLRRFGVLAVATWTLLTAAIASAYSLQQLPGNSADLGSMGWYVFLGSLLLLVPFMARTHVALRELALLAAVSTVATSLNLLVVSLFDFTPFAALTLSLLASLLVYSGARPWLMRQFLGSGRLRTEHLFEQLYRTAREVEAEPQRTPKLVARLVGELFDPLVIRRVEGRQTARSRVASDGSSLVVPLPRLAAAGEETGGLLLMRFAHRGRRLFSAEDARLTDRIVEQLQRAVTFDRAVEQGRHEERLRLAQDLHDDIGARLLTLMYQAQSTEMEEYLRHTLLDLKTLTRGLAASNHRLSHATAEWKADLVPRLTAAQIESRCSFVYDEDVLLTVGQWSALTRVLRELVNNSIAHARARWLEIDFRLEHDRVELTVADDGVGTDPQTWAPGLGVGGVRKRVKQLGGKVEWRRAEPRGIVCRVVVASLSAAT